MCGPPWVPIWLSFNFKFSHRKLFFPLKGGRIYLVSRWGPNLIPFFLICSLENFFGFQFSGGFCLFLSPWNYLSPRGWTNVCDPPMGSQSDLFFSYIPLRKLSWVSIYRLFFLIFDPWKFLTRGEMSETMLQERPDYWIRTTFPYLCQYSVPSYSVICHSCFFLIHFFFIPFFFTPTFFYPIFFYPVFFLPHFFYPHFFSHFFISTFF